MGSGFKNSDGKAIVGAMIQAIHENRGYLSEIDGAIGDGDHGINMDKGFSMVEAEIEGKELSMSEAMRQLGSTLVMEIGGSMGPLYGSMFKRMARSSKGEGFIDTAVLAQMMESGLAAVTELGESAVGDKTIVDTLAPAARSAAQSRDAGVDITKAIDSMLVAAERGWKSTEQMEARLGRAARLGERSKGVLDAGATSCYLLLQAMGNVMKELSQ